MVRKFKYVFRYIYTLMCIPCMLLYTLSLPLPSSEMQRTGQALGQSWLQDLQGRGDEGSLLPHSEMTNEAGAGKSSKVGARQWLPKS